MDHRVSSTQLDEETYLKLDHQKNYIPMILDSSDLKYCECGEPFFLPYGCLFCGFSFFVFSSDFVGFLWLRRQKSNFFKLDLRSTQIPLRFTKRSKIGLGTVFENHRKSRIQHYVYILSGQKFNKNAKNSQFWRLFEKPEVCGQTVLPDRSFIKNWWKMPKLKNSNATFWVILNIFH